MFGVGPKMADVQTPFCASLLCFGVQNPSLVFNQRQLAEAIFADICVCTSVEEAAASLHRDCPLEWAQFFGKNGNKFLAWRQAALSPSLLLLAITCQEASELFVGLFRHLRAYFSIAAHHSLFAFDSCQSN